jgi:hypothetical protein
MTYISVQAASIQSIATTAAIVLGGVWTYFKFIKDRIYRPRAAFSVDGVHHTGPFPSLTLVAKVENIGASKITLVHEGMGVRIHEAMASLPPFKEPAWERRKTLPIFEEHNWIESGETIRDELVLGMRGHDDTLIQIEARLVLKRAVRKNIELYSHALVFRGKDKEEEGG